MAISPRLRASNLVIGIGERFREIYPLHSIVSPALAERRRQAVSPLPMSESRSGTFLFAIALRHFDLRHGRDSILKDFAVALDSIRCKVKTPVSRPDELDAGRIGQTHFQLANHAAGRKIKIWQL